MSIIHDTIIACIARNACVIDIRGDGHYVYHMSVDPIYRHIGAIIKKRRQTLKVKQEVLAGQLSISRGSLSNIETGRQSILVHQLYRFADALQLSPHDLLPLSASDHAKIERTLLPLPDDLKESQKQQVADLIGGVTAQPLDKEGSHVRSKR